MIAKSLPGEKTLRRAGAAFGSITGDIVDKAAAQAGLKQAARGGEPVEQLGSPVLHEIRIDRSDIVRVAALYRANQFMIDSLKGNRATYVFDPANPRVGEETLTLDANATVARLRRLSII